jgi:tetratricopeptide (TPR) repeat protein
MRIALLLDSEGAFRVERPLDPNRLVTLPAGARIARSLAHCLNADPSDAAGVFVLAPVGRGVIGGNAWEALGRAVPSHDDEAIVDREIADARQLLDEGWLEPAREAFLRCEQLLTGELSDRHVDVLLALAEIAALVGPVEEAARRLDQALAIAPAHAVAGTRRLDLARRAGDHVTAALLGARLRATAPSTAENVALHRQVADDCLAAAAQAMRAASALDPEDTSLLERLRALLEAAGEHGQAVDVAVQLAERVPDRAPRARALVAAAEACALKERNPERAVALYEAAIADDPEVPAAFEAIEAVLVAAGDFAGAERAYTRHLERLAGRDTAQAALLQKLARVRETKLADRRGAIDALTQLVRLRPSDLEARARLAALLESVGEGADAVRCLEAMAWLAPTRAPTFEMLHRILARAGDVDRAYAACGVLVHLGEADIDAQLAYQQYAPEGAFQPAQPLDDLAWEMIEAEGIDSDITDLVLAIAPAAVAIRAASARGASFGRRQDPERSIITAVRTVGSIARFLGLPAQAVYLAADDVSGGIAVLPASEPSISLGPSVLSGRSVAELTFLIARELAVLKMSGGLLPLVPALSELRAIVTAGLSLALPAVGRSPDLAPIQAELAKQMTPAERHALAVAASRLAGSAKNLTRLDLVEWVRGIERTACRIALLATGDITVAARALSVDGRAVAGMTAAERVRDLIPFSISQRYSGLRSAMGISARPSSLPPAPPSTRRVLEPDSARLS